MTNAELRADLREARWKLEANYIEAMRHGVGVDLGTRDAHRSAVEAAAHLGPDPVEEAFERYREAVIAYEARERTGQAIYWEHMEPIIAARCALDAAIRAEAA